MRNPGDDNELDHLSREAAGKYDIPGEPNWQKMQEELDRILPVQPGKTRTAFLWWVLPILLLGGTTYWLLEKKQDTVIPIIKTGPVRDAAPANTQVLPKENTVAVPKNETVEKKIIAESHLDKIAATEKTKSSPPVLSLQKTGKKSLPASDHLAMMKDPMVTPGWDKTITNLQKSNPAEQSMTGMPGITDVKSNSETAAVNNGKPAEKNIISGNIVSSKEPATEAATNPAALKKELPLVSKGNGWSYALLAGVDKSTVKFRYGNDPGFNIGVLGGYHFNNRLSVHTGAIYTQKNYKMAGEDFTAPKGSWVSYYKLENVEGYCRMWEVPMLLRYVISNHAKNSVYLSTGLSSYFMTNENYNYFYYSAGQPVTRNTAYPSTDTHILSIAHLSVGFENQLSKNLSFQVEPYAKLPLGGVGFGNINLSSFGLNFSVQHRKF